jgi:hypothetical protein
MTTPLTENNNFDSTVSEYDTTDPVQGGVGGAANVPIVGLTNRTRWLFNQVSAILTALAAKAPSDSPTFINNPHAPTKMIGDATTALATMQAIQQAKGLASVGFAGSSNTTLNAGQAGCAIIALIGTPSQAVNAIFPATAGYWLVVNETAQPITCKTAGGTGVVVAAGVTVFIWGDTTNIYNITPQQVTTTVNNTTANPFSPPVGDISGAGPLFWWWDPNTGYTRVWGSVAQAISHEGGVNILFPIIFGHAQTLSATADNSGGSNSGSTSMQRWVLNNDGCTVFAQDNQGNSSAYATGIDISVDGYSATRPVANTSYVSN